MAGSVQAPLTSFDVELEPIQLVAPDGTPTARDPVPPRPSTRDAGLALRADGRHPRARRGVRQPAAAGRTRAVRVVPRSGGRADRRRRRACARPTGCSRSTARSARSWCGASRPAQMGAVWRGRWHGGLGFTEKCVAPIAIPIGTHGLHAVGAAMAAQRLGEDSVTRCLPRRRCDERGRRPRSAQPRRRVQGAVRVLRAEQPVGDLRSGQQAAGGAVDRAPRDRLRDARHPRRRQRRAGLLRGDGRGRRSAPATGGGPTLIEAVTYRMGPHTTSDDPTRYRSRGGGRHVGGAGSDSALPHLLTEHRRVDRTAGAPRRRRGRSDCAPNCATPSINTPDIDVGEMFDTVYADITPTWRAQRDQLMAELAKEA